MDALLFLLIMGCFELGCIMYLKSKLDELERKVLWHECQLGSHTSSLVQIDKQIIDIKHKNESSGDIL